VEGLLKPHEIDVLVCDSPFIEVLFTHLCIQTSHKVLKDIPPCCRWPFLTGFAVSGYIFFNIALTVTGAGRVMWLAS
jgi:hypothetical protein